MEWVEYGKIKKLHFNLQCTFFNWFEQFLFFKFFLAYNNTNNFDKI